MNFSLKSKYKRSNNNSELIMYEYKLWKEYLQNNNSGFFMLYNDFKKFLPEISTGALKLYLFYGFHSKNLTGESWYSIDTIANHLDTTPRSINTWNSELEKLGLIYRSADNKSSKTTYLVPYSNYIVNSNQDINEFLDDYLNNKFMINTLGNIKRIFHIFQWRQGESKGIYDKPLNLIIIEFNKKYNLIKSNKTDSRKKIFIFELNNVINEKFFVEIKQVYMSKDTPIFLFDSPFNIPEINYDYITKGIVINTKFDLKKSTVFKSVLDELSREDVDFTQYKKVQIQ